MIHGKIYQRAEVIGLYYIFWLLFQFLPMFFFSEFASKLFSVDVTRMSVIIDMMWKSVVIGLFIHGMSLLNLNAVISRMEPSEVSHKVRSYYINPFVIVFFSFIVGLGIWLISQGSSIASPSGIVTYLLAVIIGAVSLQISYRLEWLIFRDYLDE